MTTLSTDSTPLAPMLEEPLRQVAARERLLAVARGFFQWTALVMLTALPVAFALGMAERMPVAVSIPLAGVVWIAALAGAVRFMRPAMRSRSLAQTARLVDGAMPESHERLTSAVELSQQGDGEFAASEELTAHLFRQAERDVKKMDPAAVISGRGVFRAFVLWVGALAVWAVALMVYTPTVWEGVQRLAAPWTSDQPIAGPVLHVSPGNAALAEGDSLAVTVEVAPAARASVEARQRTDGATFTATYPGGQTVTSAMERTGDHAFRMILDNVQQNLNYQVGVGETASPLFRVEVRQRPAVKGISLSFEYPPYTGLKPRTEESRDGAIDAVAGTKVRITVESTRPLKTASLKLVDNKVEAGTLGMVAEKNSTTRFAGELTLTHSRQYRLALQDEESLANKDDGLRAIVVRPDAVPQVSIVSPGASIRVRPDDVVPVRFSATDDFGLGKIEVLVAVDALAPQVVEVVLPAAVKQHTADFVLNVADVLKSRAVAGGAEAQRVTYQFRVTDNRQPEAQSSVSALHTLVLDRKATPLAQREDTVAARDLTEAVKQASEKVESARKKIEELRKAGEQRPLTAAEKQAMAEARNELSDAAKQLSGAAEKSQDSAMKSLAENAKEIAEKHLTQAAEKMAQGQLNADEGKARKEAIDQAALEAAEAKEKLDALNDRLATANKDQKLAQELGALAEKQRQIAEQLRKNPNDPAALAAQKKLQEQVEKLIRENPELQEPAREAAKEDLEKLAKQLRELEAEQKRLEEKLATQSAAERAREDAAALAEKQKALNEKIEKFNRENAEALKNAGAKPPEKPQMESIPNDLKENKLANAEQQQKATGSQLESASEKLAAAGKKEEQTSAAREAAAKQAEKKAQDAAELKKQSQDLAEQIAKAKKEQQPPTRPSDPANKAAQELADKVKQESREAARKPETKSAGEEAGKLADDAKKDAQQGKAESAQQKLAEATKKLSEAAEQQKQATSKSAGEKAAGEASKAAEQAKQLAEEQKQLAEKTNQSAKSQPNADEARQQAGQTQKEQQQLAEKMEQVSKDAKALQEKTQRSAPETAKQAQKVAERMQQAAESQKQAAEQQKQGQAQKAQESSGQAKKAMGEAAEALPNGGGGAGEKGTGQQAKTEESKDAAKSIQSARSAQQQAAGGDPAKAMEAAEQLSKASKRIAEGVGRGDGPAKGTGQSGTGQTGTAKGGNGQSGNGQNGNGQMAEGAKNLNGPGGEPGREPGSGKSGTGIKPDAKGGPVEAPPKAIQDIGLSPSDWARLPPAMRSDLLNSAQQSGPPAYREAIKNYYSRIARMQPEEQ